MTPRQVELFKEKKWTELIMSLAVGHQHILVFDNKKDMQSCRTVCWRVNAFNDTDRKFSLRTDTTQKALVITVQPVSEPSVQ